MITQTFFINDLEGSEERNPKKFELPTISRGRIWSETLSKDEFRFRDNQLFHFSILHYVYIIYYNIMIIILT